MTEFERGFNEELKKIAAMATDPESEKQLMWVYKRDKVMGEHLEKPKPRLWARIKDPFWRRKENKAFVAAETAFNKANPYPKMTSSGYTPAFEASYDQASKQVGSLQDAMKKAKGPQKELAQQKLVKYWDSLPLSVQERVGSPLRSVKRPWWMSSGAGLVQRKIELGQIKQ